MTRQEIEERLKVAGQRHFETQDPKAWDEVEWCSSLLADLDNLAVVEAALISRRDEDLRTTEVDAALKSIETHATIKWPFQQWREALNCADNETRWQQLKASLDEIRFALNFIYPIRP